MTEAQKILLELLAKELFGKQITLPADADWKQVLQEAQNQAVIQIASNAIPKGLLDQETAGLWSAKASSVIANNIRVVHNHELLHQWMSEGHIPYVILKGCSSAHYYPVPINRAMGDVDFLVPDEYLEQAEKILEEQGLTPWDEEHISHIVYRKKGMHLEMHFNVAGTPEGKAGDLVREYMKDVFEKAQLEPVGSGRAYLPSPFHHGLIILLHTCHHMTGEGVGLRHLCDWAVFENSLSDAEFRNLFEEKLKALGLWKFAQILTRTSIRYLGAEERTWAVCDEEVPEELMEDILTGGNFGRKDKSRSTQTMLISDRGKNGLGRTGMVSQFTKAANGIVCQHWPAARKNKLLLPAGWVYFGGRRIIREMTGKRNKTNIKHVVDSASERRSLYMKMHLYEAE